MYFYIQTINDIVYHIYYENFELSHKNLNMYKFKITFEHLYLLKKECNNFIYIHIPLNFYYSLYDVNNYLGCKIENKKMLEIDLNFLKKMKYMKLKSIG